MKSYFQENPVLETINDKVSELHEDFVYYSEKLERFIVVPSGFQTDFASILRIPIIYLLFANRAKKAAIIHDFLYRKDGLNVSKEIADKIFLEAMKASKINIIVRYCMYGGVIIFGHHGYHNKKILTKLVK